MVLVTKHQLARELRKDVRCRAVKSATPVAKLKLGDTVVDLYALPE